MFLIHKCLLKDYSIDKFNSIQKELPSATAPGHPASVALNVKIIIIEEKTVLLKQLSIGSQIAFKIEQEILSEDNEVSWVKGEGSGEISEISSLNRKLDDNEYQELTITLINGFAENL